MHQAWSLAADSCVVWLQVGAAVLGVAVKPTIKEADKQGQVVKTLQRACLWEVQTPQVCLLVASVPAAGEAAGAAERVSVVPQDPRWPPAFLACGDLM